MATSAHTSISGLTGQDMAVTALSRADAAVATAAILKQTGRFDSVADMVAFDAATPDVGSIDTTNSRFGGYNATASTGARGANTYQLMDAGSSGARPTADGGHIIHVGDAGLYRMGIFPNGVNVEQFGVLVDGTTSDGAAINLAITYANAAGFDKVAFPDGTMATSTAIIPKSNVHLVGDKGLTVIKALNTMTAVLTALTATSNVKVEGIKFDANLNNNTGCAQLNSAAYRNIEFTDCSFVNSKSTWSLLVGSHGPIIATEASALAIKSSRIRINNCEFDNHTSSTLEQLIIVNSDDVVIKDCEFDRNENNANTILVYSYSSNVRISGCKFKNVQNNCIGVQESSRVWITDCDFAGKVTMAGRFVNLYNCADIWVENNKTVATKAANSRFVGVYAFKGALYESDNSTAIFPGSARRIYVNNNIVDGCYSILQCPEQKNTPHDFQFSDLVISGNTVKNCGGAPIILGNYTVNDALTQTESIERIKIASNTIVDYDGFDEGWLYIKGTATANIRGLVINNNTAPAAALGTNTYGMRLSYIEDFIISDEIVHGKGSRQAIKLEFESDGIVTGNKTTGGLSFTEDRSVHIADNKGAFLSQERHLIRAKNTHGITIPAGSIVILKNAAGQTEVTMSSTAGDYRVVGVMQADTENNADGWVVVKGRVANLRANGTVAIAVGDRIGCYSSVGIAQKGATGHTAIAIAAEAYAVADSAGVIDAMVVPARYVG